mmetsp:Transcript_26001/g.62026  ORF Transcript_26001/g.62026 Transcript_26001/m.62026 type:complete len:208 (+) Transcript_26001:53-676(+)
MFHGGLRGSRPGALLFPHALQRARAAGLREEVADGRVVLVEHRAHHIGVRRRLHHLLEEFGVLPQFLQLWVRGQHLPHLRVVGVEGQEQFRVLHSRHCAPRRTHLPSGRARALHVVLSIRNRLRCLGVVFDDEGPLYREDAHAIILQRVFVRAEQLRPRPPQLHFVDGSHGVREVSEERRFQILDLSRGLDRDIKGLLPAEAIVVHL